MFKSGRKNHLLEMELSGLNMVTPSSILTDRPAHIDRRSDIHCRNGTGQLRPMKTFESRMGYARRRHTESRSHARQIVRQGDSDGPMQQVRACLPACRSSQRKGQFLACVLDKDTNRKRIVDARSSELPEAVGGIVRSSCCRIRDYSLEPERCDN